MIFLNWFDFWRRNFKKIKIGIREILIISKKIFFFFENVNVHILFYLGKNFRKKSTKFGLLKRFRKSKK